MQLVNEKSAYDMMSCLTLSIKSKLLHCDYETLMGPTATSYDDMSINYAKPRKLKPQLP